MGARTWEGSPVVEGETRFCPLHGEYETDDVAQSCPRCAEDPVASSASLRQVRVVGEDELDPEGADHAELTPLAEKLPCPVCGALTHLGDFRTESIGEVWQGDAAVYAEEGVCPDCYRDVLAPHIHDWSHADWLAHHYEGWCSTLQSVHNLFVYEESAHEGWLPDEDRHRILDVGRTLSARREHLARSQMAMRDLLARYDADLTPPPFPMDLAQAGDAVSKRAEAELRGMRARDLDVESQRRNDSVVAPAPIERPDSPDTSAVNRELVARSQRAVPRPRSREGWVVPVVLLAGLIAVASAVLFLIGKG